MVLNQSSWMRFRGMAIEDMKSRPSVIANSGWTVPEPGLHRDEHADGAEGEDHEQTRPMRASRPPTPASTCAPATNPTPRTRYPCTTPTTATPPVAP